MFTEASTAFRVT